MSAKMPVTCLMLLKHYVPSTEQNKMIVVVVVVDGVIFGVVVLSYCCCRNLFLTCKTRLKYHIT